MDSGTPINADTAAPPRAAVLEELVSLGFARETLAALAPALTAIRLVSYHAGATLYHAGSEAETLYVIQQGRIKMLTHLETGRVRIVRLHKRGSIIGLNGLLAEPHAHTAMAIDEVQAYQIPMRMIKSITAKDADTYSQLLEHWHAYLQLADTWITDFSTGAIRGRVARLLRYLVETEEGAGPCEVHLLTVEEMAEILGVTSESVSRVMADMKRSNILQAVAGDASESYLCDMRKLLEESEL